MSDPNETTSYSELMKNVQPPPQEEPRAEDELDALIGVLSSRSRQAADGADPLEDDPILTLRKLTLGTLVPVFVELVEKYSQSGISMQMDASNFLEGGREIKFEFGLGEYRSQLQGTVTTEGIAFHETRYSPAFRGELTSGPMLRLRGLNAETFRQFVCERLTFLLRSVARRR